MGSAEEVAMWMLRMAFVGAALWVVTYLTAGQLMLHPDADRMNLLPSSAIPLAAGAALGVAAGAWVARGDASVRTRVWIAAGGLLLAALIGAGLLFR